MTVPQSRSFDVLGLDLDGAVAVPDGPTGVVLFARVPGTQDNERDARVAWELNNVRIATVMVDLLTAAEQRIDAATAELRYDADLLGVRVVAIIDKLASEPPTARLPGGVLGSHSGAAAALVAAAARPDWVRGVASHSGRPDLAGEFLLLVHAPTLLVVGEYDAQILELNQEAEDRIPGPARVAVIPDAGHQLDEPGAMSLVADLSRDWFRELLRIRTAASAR